MDKNFEHVDYSIEKLSAIRQKQLDEAASPPFTEEKRQTLLLFIDSANKRKQQLLGQIIQKNKRIANLEVQNNRLKLIVLVLVIALVVSIL